MKARESSEKSPPQAAPTRILLDPSEVTAGFVAVSKRPPDSPLFADLPAYSGTIPQRLTDGMGRLKPEFAAIFDVLADPKRSLAIDIFVPGSAAYLGARVLSSVESLPCVLLSLTADGLWDLALLTEMAQLLVVVDDLIGLSQLPSRDESESVNLSMPALAALVAFGDLLEEEELQRKLARTHAPLRIATSPIVVDDLLRVLEQGLDSDDTRWGTALNATLGEGELAACRSLEDLAEGVRQLGELGLVDEDGIPGVAAIGFARILCAPSAAISIVSAHGGPTKAYIDRFVVYRTPELLLFGVWSESEASGPTLALSQKSPRSLLALVGETMTATLPSEESESSAKMAGAAGSKYCAQCGARMEPLARFCTGCGAKVTTA
jgi:hypothetical protein